MALNIQIHLLEYIEIILPDFYQDFGTIIFNEIYYIVFH